MLDVQVRDAGARLSAWEAPQGTVRLPAVAHVHTERHPAPAFASLVLAREAHPDHPTVVVPGSVFTPGAPPEGPGVLPRTLVYPPSVGRKLQAAADERHPEGAADRIVHLPEDLEATDGVVVLPNARSLARDPWRLASFLVEARTRAGPNAVVFAPGIGLASELALAAYAGVDVLDGLAPVLAGLKRQYLTTEAVIPLEELGEPAQAPCACPACLAAAEAGTWSREALVEHNRWSVETEARRVRQALAAGTLRELVEARVRAAPELVATLRRLDTEHASFLEASTPALRTRELPILGRTSLGRPEVRRWVDRLGTRYAPPPEARILVVVPCSATKPYGNSRTHRRIRPVLHRNGKGRTHVVTLTSPLGAVPEELELAYPAAHYDIPVTGTWFDEERALVDQAFTAVHDAGTYDHVLLHLVPEEADLLADRFPKAQRTVPEGASPTDDTSLANLREAVVEAARPYEAVPGQQLFTDHMRARVAWQFGRGTEGALMDEVRLKGKFPRLRLVAPGNTQLALLQPERGGALALTADGGRRLYEAVKGAGTYCVEIDDFHPKGTVFAAGVKGADPGIRVEDEVLVVHDGELRAVGRAVMPGHEMGRMNNGGAVEVRHRV